MKKPLTDEDKKLRRDFQSELRKHFEPERMDISIFCSSCGKEIGYGYVGNDDGLILNYNGEFLKHAKKGHDIILRKRTNVAINLRMENPFQVIKEGDIVNV